MVHPKIREFEQRLKEICSLIDCELEQEWGDLYPLHPNRQRVGTTSNPAMDGLFQIQSRFTPGYGSDYGRGYIVEIKFSTLETVDSLIKERLSNEVIDKLKIYLKKTFSDKDFLVKNDKGIIKILGDLSLGEV